MNRPVILRLVDETLLYFVHDHVLPSSKISPTSPVLNHRVPFESVKKSSAVLSGSRK
jgi:hypothetical protein